MAAPGGTALVVLGCGDCAVSTLQHSAEPAEEPTRTKGLAAALCVLLPPATTWGWRGAQSPFLTTGGGSVIVRYQEDIP